MKSPITLICLLLLAAPSFAADTKPTPIKLYQPDYPAKLRKEGVQGVVVVEILIGTDGRVSSAKAIESPDPRLSELAEKAMLKCKFNPGTKDGVPIVVRARYPLTFSLKKNEPNK